MEWAEVVEQPQEVKEEVQQVEELLGGMLGGGSNKNQSGRQHRYNKDLMGIQQQNQRELNQQQYGLQTSLNTQQYGNQKGLNEQQYGHQKGLNSQQVANQKMLNEQGKKLQMEMWKETNYPAQMKMMEEAGLNPALMYGMSGGGGTTTGSQGGGSASGGSASGGSASGGSASAGSASGGGASMGHKTMDMSQIVGAAKAAAEIKLLNSQTKKNEAEAEKTIGVDTEKTKRELVKIIAETRNERLKEILIRYQSDTEAGKSKLVIEEAKKTAEQVDSLVRENEIGDATKDEIIEGIGIDVINKEVETRLKESKRELNAQQREELEHRIYQNWINTGSKTIGELGGLVNKLINTKAFTKNMR